MTKRTDKTMTTANGTMTAAISNKTHRAQGEHSPATSVVNGILTIFESEVRTVMGVVCRRIHKLLTFNLQLATCNFSISAVALIAVLALVMVFGTLGAAEAAVTSLDTWTTSTGTAGYTQNYTAPNGTNRVVIAVVSAESGTAVSNVQIGGVAATTIAQVQNGNAQVYIGYRVIGDGSGETMNVTSTGGTAIGVGTYGGVEQAAGQGSSNAINSIATGTAGSGTTTTSTSVFNATGGAVVNQVGGLVIYGINENQGSSDGQVDLGTSSVWTFIEQMDRYESGGGNRTGAGNGTGATANDAGSSTVSVGASTAHNRSALVAFALNQVSCVEGQTVSLDAVPDPITGDTQITATTSGTNPEVRWNTDGGGWNGWLASGSTYTPPASATGTVQFEARATGDCGLIYDSANPTTTNYDTTCTDLTPSTITIGAGQTAYGNPYDASALIATTGNVGSFEYKVTSGSSGGAPFDQLDADWGGGNHVQLPTVTSNWTDTAGLSWCVQQGTTPSSGPGPSTGNPDPYLYHEASSASGTDDCQNGFALGDTIQIESNLVDAGAYALTFDFDYNFTLNGSTDTCVHVDVWDDDNQIWDTNVSDAGSGMTDPNDGNSPAVFCGDNNDTWTTASIDLDALGYQSSQIRIALRVVTGTSGTSWHYDTAFDNLHIYGPARNVETTCTDWTTNNMIPASGTPCDPYVTDPDNYNLFVRGTDPDCGGSQVISSPASQTFSWDPTPPCDVTNAPTVSVDSVTNNSVTISWTTVPNAVSYKVYRGGTDLGTQTSPFTDTGRTANTSYNYTVVGVGSSPAGCEGPGGTTSALTLPNAAGDPTYSGVSETSLTVNWTAPAGGADSYDVYRGGALQGNTTATSFPDSGLSVNTQYSYYVVAKNASGDAAASATTNVYTLAAIPSAPTVGSPTGNTLNVTLGADSNPVGTAYAIRINGGAFTNQYVQIDGSVGAAETWLSAAAWGTTTVTGLTAATTYTFDVKARNGDLVDTAFGGTGADTTLAFDPTTTAGTATAMADDKSIHVTAPYLGDDNTDNSVTVSWGPDGVDCATGSQVFPNAPSPYSYTITGLTNGTAYQVCVDYTDADGVNGVASQTLTGLVPTNPLLHNAVNTESTKHGGTWGLPGGTYGEITCDTCHEPRATNIKGIKSVITSPNSPTEDFPGSNVIFTDARNGSSDFGDDTGGHTTSQKVCEICHTITSYHRYDTTGQTVLDHNNQTSCVSCHPHNAGFKAGACDSCHGEPPLDASAGGPTGLANNPFDTNSTTAGAHDTHVNILGFTDCATCHNGYTMPQEGAIAGKGDISISFLAFGSTNGTYGGQLNVSYNGVIGDGTKACSNVYCHGGTIGGSAAIWDGTITCGDCHGASAGDPPILGSHVAHVGNAGLGISCSDCHGTGAGSQGHVNGNVAWDLSTVDPTGSYKTVTTGSTGGLAPSLTYGSCSNIACHYNNSATWGDSPLDCTSCHNDGVNSGLVTDSAPNQGAHATHMDNTSNIIDGGVQCSDCHVVPATIEDSGHWEVPIQAEVPFPAGSDALLNGTATSWSAGTCTVYCHGANMPGGSTDGTNTTPAWTDSLTGCDTCHGTPPNTSHHSGVNPDDWAECITCHDDTVTDATPTVDTTFHLNGVIDASCIACHSSQQGNRVAVVDQFGANSHHIQGVTLNKSQCAACHWEANEDGSVNPTYHTQASGQPVDLVTNWTASRPATYSGNNVQYTADGSRAEIAKVTTHCLGCHDDDSASADPFGDGNNPETYAWDGDSIASKYSDPDTTTWGKYTSTTNAAQKNATKAYSAHGNAGSNVMGWSTSSGVDASIPNRTGGIDIECFDCHNSHGSTATGTTASYASATPNGAMLKDITSGMGGYTATYKPADSVGSSTMVAHNAGAALCFDCHLTANASGTQPWGYSTFGATDRIMGYLEKVGWEGGVGVNSAGAQQRYGYKDNLATSGGHFGASAALSTTPMGTINGLCTPCHDPHGVSASLGVNKQYGVPLLKGTWMTSPYKEDAAPSATNEARGGGRNENPFNIGSRPGYHIDQNTFTADGTAGKDSHTVWDFNATATMTEGDQEFGGLCMNCHDQTELDPDGSGTSGGTWRSYDRIHDTVKGWGDNSMHNYSCSKCHTPHSSCLPRLMITNCLDAEHRGQVQNGGSETENTGGNDGGCGGCRGTGQGRYPAGGGGYAGSNSQNRSDVWSTGSGGAYYFGNPGTSASTAPTFRTCHEGQTGGWPDNSWNTVTPWN